MSSLKFPIGIDDCNCFTLRKAARQITRFYDGILEPVGLRLTQFLTLAALNEVERLPINVLAERLDIERTAMGKMLGFLERDGLVALEPSPVDARTRLARLTPAGESLFEKAAPLWLEAQRQFEQLNGAETALSLRQELQGMKVGLLPDGSSGD